MLSFVAMQRSTRQSAVAFTPKFHRLRPKVMTTQRCSMHESSLSGQNNENVPDLILPSHPGTLIRTVMA